MASAKVSSVENINTLPEPLHITLLLRHHKSTTLISVSPTQSFDSIKELLLAALQARGISTLHNASDPTDPTPLPASAEELELGVLADKKDASKGWRLITPDLAASSAGKKKASSKAADFNSPEGLGFVDGSWLAYRVSRAAAGGSQAAKDEDGDIDVDAEMLDDPGWDVVIPTFEDEEEGAEDEAAEARPS